ncbi:hypothetical protein EDD28_2434 [Salana multivorans]|uniref:Uncharacterized protein n=1 Tax=Salana multivorans TaxID=120377 RepID=A0A3N2DDF1_9MICO|nr:hypothetical protein [Salana multivorans]ROR97825.1 hypothetical protein EDD28_2434 [Salana multivorans]
MSEQITTLAELEALPPLVQALTNALAEDRADDNGIDVGSLVPEARRLAAILRHDPRLVAEAVAAEREGITQAIEAMGDDEWRASVEAYHQAGWEGDPTDYDRMFWEAGLRRAARIASEYGQGGAS